MVFRKRLSWLAPLVILIGIIIGVGAGYMGIDLHLERKIITETETLQKEIELVPIIKSIEEEPVAETTDEETVDSKEITTEENEMVANVQKANIHLEYDIGFFEIEFPTTMVYQCQVDYRYPEFKPIENYSISNYEANIHIYHESASSADKQFRNPKNHINLKLNKEIIYDILIETGATTVNYDLSKFKVNKLDIKSGASDINIIAPQYDGEININSGVSKINIAIPANVGTVIRLDTGLNIKELDEAFQIQENNTYISKNYNDSEYNLNINIDSGLSQINIHYL